MEIIQANGATLAGVLIRSIVRNGGAARFRRFRKLSGLQLQSDLYHHPERPDCLPGEKPEMAEHLAAVKAYREEFGFKETRRMKSHPASYYCNCAELAASGRQNHPSGGI